MQRYNDSKVQRFKGTKIRRYKGPKVQRYKCTKDQMKNWMKHLDQLLSKMNCIRISNFSLKKRGREAAV